MLEPISASAANTNINNNIYITQNVASDSDVVKELDIEKVDVLISRSVELEEIKKPYQDKDFKLIILETYAKIQLHKIILVLFILMGNITN